MITWRTIFLLVGTILTCSSAFGNFEYLVRQTEQKITMDVAKLIWVGPCCGRWLRAQMHFS